jgi:hypothetical protein
MVRTEKQIYIFEKVAGENTFFIERAYKTLSAILSELIADRITDKTA